MQIFIFIVFIHYIMPFIFYFLYAYAFIQNNFLRTAFPHQTGPLYKELRPASVGVSSCFVRWVSSPVHGSKAAQQLWLTALKLAGRSSASSAERARASWADGVCQSPSGGNKLEGLKRPGHDDKNLSWPKRISLTVLWTLFGSRGWLSRRVMRSWKWGSLCFFSLVVQRDDKMAARARRACSGCELNPNMFTKNPQSDHSCCLWR